MSDRIPRRLGLVSSSKTVTHSRSVSIPYRSVTSSYAHAQASALK